MLGATVEFVHTHTHKKIHVYWRITMSKESDTCIGTHTLTYGSEEDRTEKWIMLARVRVFIRWPRKKFSLWFAVANLACELSDLMIVAVRRKLINSFNLAVMISFYRLLSTEPNSIQRNDIRTSTSFGQCRGDCHIIMHMNVSSLQ